MKKLLIFLMLLNTAHAESWQCNSKTTFDDGWTKELNVTISIENDAIKYLSVESCIGSGQEGGGSCCLFDSNEVLSNGGKYRLTNSYHVFSTPDATSKFLIHRQPNALVIETDIDRYYCGFSSEVPSTIKIKKGISNCQIH